MAQNLTAELLAWYKKNGRDLPWRVKGGAHFDAYAVWISEIMLQQTTVATVIDYFDRWMKRFPTVADLAMADLGDVLLMWQGLGYYTRARKIHECAKVLMEKYGGQLPADREALLKLPGIGPYSASSICCFAFNMPETVVDGNVIRVISRLYGITDEVSAKEIYPLAVQLTSQEEGADYASAIMDLGATVCTPARPRCELCPWADTCVAKEKGIQESIPKIKKLEKKIVTGQVYVVQNNKGAYLIRQRSEKGLLHGLWEFPWQESPLLSGKHPTITHVFTHFKLTLQVVFSEPPAWPDNAVWVAFDDFSHYPFSTLMQKVIKKIK